MANLKVLAAGPLVTVQDQGRRGLMRKGITGSGPVDELAFATVNTALGNPAGAAMIEVSLGGLELECLDAPLNFATAGGQFTVQLNGAAIPPWGVARLAPGDLLSIKPGPAGSWCYLGFAGGLINDEWMGAQSTHSLSGFGGGALAAGQKLEVIEPRSAVTRQLAFPTHAYAPALIRVVMGPQDHQFEPEAIETLLSSDFSMTSAYDRMGVKLSGPELALKDALSIPSEPILKGSLQVSGDGQPTALLADHQTTGGYPKIATVIGADLARLSQLRAPAKLQFAAIEPAQAVSLARSHHSLMQSYLTFIANPDPHSAEAQTRANLLNKGWKVY